MNLMDALRTRRAVREFLPDPVDPRTLRRLIDAAVLAPSSMNRQPWSFTVVGNRPLIDEWARHAKSRALAVYGADQDHPELRAALLSPGFHVFHHAPALIIISATESDEMARADCCLAAENLMLSATEHGLGTCWIGLAAPWMNHPEGRAALFLPEGCSVVAPIIVGHPRTIPDSPARREPHITWMPAAN